jgi:two-component system cell cycle sensor histidine kinase/response regulator CckA
LLASAFESSPDSLAVVHRAHIFHANDAFARLFGYSSAAELIEKPLADLLPSNHRCAEYPVTCGRAEETCGYPGCRFEGRHQDGSHTQMEASCAHFHSGVESFLVLAARDISKQERRRVVRESEKRYRAIFDAAAIGIVQCIMDGRVVECNPAFEKMIGYSRQELRGMHFRDFTHPEDVDADIDLFEEMVAGKRDHYQIELRTLCKDKSYGWVRLTVSLVRGPAGEPEFAIGMVEDITQRKSAEAQLREAQKMEVLGRLVGGIAHDFNNLLTAVTLYADLLAAGLGANHRLQRHVDEIRMASEQGGALILHLLAMVRRQPVEPQLVDLNSLVADMRNMLARLIGEHIELRTRLARNLSAVRVDPVEMQQVLLNLVLNARDALADGGHIRVETRNCERLCSLQRNGEPVPASCCVALVVADDGCGMDAETRSHLFEPFFTTKTPGQGNGLGLATVQAITRQAGGTIEVQTEAKKGTTVTVLLPCAQEARLSRSRASSKGLVKRGSETILLVEDDSQVRGSIQRVLRKYGYKVLAAANGADAAEKACNYQATIHLLVTDLVMPGMSGREVARRLRAIRPELRVLATSGFEHPPTEAGEDSRDFVFFRKPFTGRSLARRVREVLDAEAVSEKKR